MGMLVNGVWQTDEAVSAQQNTSGQFVRASAKVRHWISNSGPFEPEAGRYHIFGAHNCPWSQRCLITRNLKSLGEAISVSIANMFRNEQGWWYPEGLDELQPEDGQLPLHRVFSHSDPSYTGRVTLPVLHDRKTGKMVSNESADIIRMLNGPLSRFGSGGPDLCPPELAEKIDAVNTRVYKDINNGVYRCGFAASQQAYEAAFHELFDALAEMDARLDNHRYLVGDGITEADVRLFPTLVRFDPVYYSHFKCNKRRIADFPNLSGYLRDLYQTPGFGETVHIDIYKRGYYGRSQRLNPSGIIPVGPELSYELPHDRGQRSYG